MEPLPIVDLERLMRVSRGNAERAREFFGALVDDAQIACERIREALEAGDGYAIRELAHSLKGMALEVGAPRLAAAAAVLEAERDPGLLPGCVAGVGKATAELPDGLDML